MKHRFIFVKFQQTLTITDFSSGGAGWALWFRVSFECKQATALSLTPGDSFGFSTPHNVHVVWLEASAHAENPHREKRCSVNQTEGLLAMRESIKISGSKGLFLFGGSEKDSLTCLKPSLKTTLPQLGLKWRAVGKPNRLIYTMTVNATCATS